MLKMCLKYTQKIENEGNEKGEKITYHLRISCVQLGWTGGGGRKEAHLSVKVHAVWRMYPALMTPPCYNGRSQTLFPLGIFWVFFRIGPPQVNLGEIGHVLLGGMGRS